MADEGVTEAFYCHSCGGVDLTCPHDHLPLRPKINRCDLDLLKKLRPGDVVQIMPSEDPKFGGCLMIVTKVHDGTFVSGYVRTPGSLGDCAIYFHSCRVHEVAFVGTAEWVMHVQG